MHRPALPLSLTQWSQTWLNLQVPSGWSAEAGCSFPVLKKTQQAPDEAENLPLNLVPLPGCGVPPPERKKSADPWKCLSLIHI